MQMSLFTRGRPTVLTRLIPIAMVMALTACASKNPLIDQPASAPATTTPPTPVQAKPAITQATTQNVQAPTGTKRWLGIFSPYKLDIQQGNFISQEMAAQLKEGLTKEQVRFLLGVPLLTDMFHSDRWDYLFRLQKADGQLTTNRLTIHFKENRVTRFDSTPLPGEVEYISHISGTKPPSEQPKTAQEAKPATK